MILKITWSLVSTWGGSSEGIKFICGSTVERIPGNAFVWTGVNITELFISDSVKEIGKDAFEASNIEKINVSEKNNYFSEENQEVLYSKDKTRLIWCLIKGENKSFSVPDGVEVICENAFSGSDIINIEFADSVTKIEENAFYCSGLQSVVLPERIVSIGERAFKYCYYLTKIEIRSVENIGAGAFASCYDLKVVTIPENVKYIGEGAFYDCLEIADVYYEGTEEQWRNIEISSSNECLQNATIHHNSKGIRISGFSVGQPSVVELTAFNVPYKINAYLACYDGVGNLIDFQIVTLTDGYGQTTVATEEIRKIKAFLWENDILKPLCSPDEYEAL